MQPSPNSTTPHSEFPTPDSPSPHSEPRRRGRPRRLTERDLLEICAYVSGGLGLEHAAEYVGCSVNTIRREALRNPDFEERLHNAMLRARLHPLTAMQKAAATHWRAAAWMLERTFPERFGRPDPGSFGARDARELMEEVLIILKSNLADPEVRNNPHATAEIVDRITATFEYYLHRATSCRRTRRGLRRETELKELKNRPVNRFTESGDRIPTIDEIMRGMQTPPPPRRASNPTPQSPEPVRGVANAKPADPKVTTVNLNPRPTVPREQAPNTQPTSSSSHAPTAPTTADSVRRGSPDPAAPPTAGLPHSPPTPRHPQQPRPTLRDDPALHDLFQILADLPSSLGLNHSPITSTSAPSKTQ